jgi:hypothetical protein
MPSLARLSVCDITTRGTYTNAYTYTYTYIYMQMPLFISTATARRQRWLSADCNILLPISSFEMTSLNTGPGRGFVLGLTFTAVSTIWLHELELLAAQAFARATGSAASRTASESVCVVIVCHLLQHGQLDDATAFSKRCSCKIECISHA